MPRPADDPVHCAAPGCERLASIIHREIAYCGKHALAALELDEARREERPLVIRRKQSVVRTQMASTSA